MSAEPLVSQFLLLHRYVVQNVTAPFMDAMQNVAFWLIFFVFKIVVDDYFLFGNDFIMESSIVLWQAPYTTHAIQLIGRAVNMNVFVLS